MPAKKTITKERILKAAMDLIRESGMDGLNMRAIAGRCNCSTQPIYQTFNGMEDLKNELGKLILSEFDKYIKMEYASGKYPEYKAFGMGYIRFAKEEKELFKNLMLTGRRNEFNWETESFDAAASLIQKNYGLDREKAIALHVEMWIFVHGIATMLATDYIDWDWETVSNMVTDAYFGFTARLEGK